MKVFLSMLCLLYAVRGYTLANKTKLHKDLFTNYKKEFRPGDNQIIPTELDFSFYMRSLKELKESYGEMGVVGSLGVEWRDVRLAWNPQDYDGNLYQTSVFVQNIWTPYLVLMNPYEESKPILSGGFSCDVRYNGYVSCLPPPNLFEALCISDVRLYPFDSKTCKLQLYVSGYRYHSSDLDVRSQSRAFNMEMYAGNGPWKILSTDIFVNTININNKSVEILELKIKVKRSSGRHLWDLVPILILSVLQNLVFFLPNESGERIGYSVTVFLAEVLFLTVIQEKVPESPNYRSELVYKQMIDMLASFGTISGVVAISYLYNKANTKEAKENKETPSKMNSVCIRKETDRANIEEHEETKETPSKMNYACVRKETDQVNIEEPGETEEMPNKMNSVCIRKQKESPRDKGKRYNFIFGIICAAVVIGNNVYFWWTLGVAY